MISNSLKSRVDLVAAVAKMVELWADMRSKDPATKVAACIYDTRTGGMFFGYNGFPSCVADHAHIWNNRDPQQGLTKYDLVVHAEQNAVMKAISAGADLTHCFLVCTHIPCPKCMRDVILMNNMRTIYYINDFFHSLSEQDKKTIRMLANLGHITMEKIS